MPKNVLRKERRNQEPNHNTKHGRRHVPPPNRPRAGLVLENLPEYNRLHCPSQSVIYRESEPGKAVFAVCRGLVKLVKYLPNGQSRIVRLLETGETLGIEAALDCAYEHTAVALGDVEVGRIPVAALQRLRTTDPEAYRSLMARWHDYLRRSDVWILLFSTGSVRARVARLIVYLSRLGGGSAGPVPRTIEMLSCDDMAAILGVTAESVSRVVADLKRERILHGVIPPHRGVFIADVDALDRLACD